MTRYLIRLKNSKHCTPKDAKKLAQEIRELLGSRESIGNLRVSNPAIEFDLFAKDKAELNSKISILEKKVSEAETVKELDKAPLDKGKVEIVDEGVRLFNDERYWESHEVLEQVWQPAKGAERDIVHGMIMVATALVHSQKDRETVSLGMLKRALDKLSPYDGYLDIDLVRLKKDVKSILDEQKPRPLRITRVS